MSDYSAQPMELSPLKQAYLALEKMQAKLEAVERAKREPIAIIGMGCRLPGDINKPEEFWQLLCQGLDAVTEVPPDRWDINAYYDPDPTTPGKMSTRWGAFLKQVDQFDPQFFGIAPREAISMDPQQRLLLEVAWEALEYAGQAPDKLAGSRTGVFIGIVNNDYRQLQLETNGIANIDTYYGSGNAISVASGRLSYVLGLQGPSISIDTACSSSLVAVHLACQSLLSGECRMALAGGVNLILLPELTVAFSKFQMMAPDGRCKAFDARADGFVRGEGCGLIVLKRLSDALTDGDRILAVIKGTAANQDGASSGLTAPNGPSQEAVIREALAKAGVKPAEVSYVETHGTGTSLGDPIEVQALGAVLSEGRQKEHPLMIGSVKTNIGHLEAAAGITGLIKAVLALQYRQIPPHLHLQKLSPFIPWEKFPVVVPTELTPWPAEAPLVAGVSSFGFSGTNVHIVLAAAPSPEPAALEVDRPLHLFTLSARNEQALAELAARFQSYVTTQPETPLADLSFTTNLGRAHLPQRLAVVADSLEQLQVKLAAFIAQQDQPGLIAGAVQNPDRPKIAFLFTGQGSQYVNMGRQLYETQPTFRRALDHCAELLRPHLDQPLLSVIFPKNGAPSLIDETAYTQPALFALEYALAELWRSWGVEPVAVMGHSVGEYVAACVAGVFSLEDGLKLIAERGRLMQALPAGGAMAAVFAPEARVAAAIQPYASQVAIAAVNGPENIVISGAGSVVQTILDELALDNIKSRRLTVSHAFHSPLMEPMLDAFERTAAQITYRAPRIKLISNLTGQLAMGAAVTQPDYWRRHVREAVQFAPAIATLQAQGVELFLEIGPNPTLLGMGQRCLPEGAGLWLPSLRSGKDDWSQMLQSLAALYVYGVEIDWPGFERDYAAGRHRLTLPTYPFQRKRYWIEKKVGPPARQSSDHPLLGQRLRSALKEIQFEAQLMATTVSFLNDHRVYGLAVMPATAYIEMILTAAVEVFGRGPLHLEDLTIQEPFIINEEEVRTLQVILSPQEDNSASVQIFSQGPAETAWQLHASARVKRESDQLQPPFTPTLPKSLQDRCREQLSAEAHYRTLFERGLQFGPALHGVEAIWCNPQGGEALGQIRLPDSLEAEQKAYQIHPALLDACVQVLAAAIPQNLTQTDLYMPVGLDNFTLYQRPGSQLWSHALIQSDAASANGHNHQARETLAGSVRLLTETGQLVAEISGLRLKRASQEALLHLAQPNLDDWLYQVEWQPKPLALTPTAEAPALTVGFLPALDELVKQVQPSLSSMNQQYGLEEYHSLAPQIDALSVAYIIHAWQQLGWTAQAGERMTVKSLAEKLGILAQYHRLLERMLAMLAEDGFLRPVGPDWEVLHLPAPTTTEVLQKRWAELLAQYPTFEAELTFIGRCGPHLAEVLTGAADPLQLLFPGSNLATAEKLYQTSPFSQAYNALVRAAVTAAVADLPAGRKLRVLEIGGGTGGTTSYVLPQLPVEQTEYIFTDVSPLFTARAAQKFSDYPFVRYQPLDIEQDPLVQDLPAHQFDLIVAANVIHATANLPQTLANVQQLLAPDGLLVMLEMTKPERWVDLTFGLTEGWWKFTDTYRTDSPLLPQERWLSIFEAAGFASAMAIPEKLSSEKLPEQAVLLARAPKTGLGQSRENWLIFADENGLGQKLAASIEARQGRCVLVSPGTAFEQDQPDHYFLDPAQPAAFKHLLQDALVDPSSGWQGIVHLWGLNNPFSDKSDAGTLSTAQALTCGSVLHLVQALAERKDATTPRLWLATAGAQPVEAEGAVTAVAQSPLWGLGQVIALEHPELRCVRVDLDPTPGVDNSQLLADEIWSDAEEDQVAFRQQERYVAHLTRYVAKPVSTKSVSPDQQPVQLTIATRGTLDNLALQPLTRRQPGAGEVEIRVRATGLNFKDVLNALGMYPGDAGPLGGECAGEVVALGTGVDGLQVGDAVAALAPGSFSTFVTTRADFVVPKPAQLTFEEAATIPIPYLTAYYTLCYLGRLSAGERVLIHAAAGGVGLAAVQLAQRSGAEIFGTAGSPEKRAYLKSLGVQHVLDSRSLDFAGEILQLTQGQGVDVVLNSLADEFVTKSLSVLANGGRFLEIGKRGILSESQMADLRPDAAYFIVDWTEACQKEPALIHSMFQDLMAAVAAGDLKPLPRRVFPLPEVSSAFRFMAQAKHIGKIVVSQELPATRSIRADGTYLITGGLGGLGLMVAQWLADQGARHLVLMGRSGASTAAQEDAIRAIEQTGTQVVVAQADVSAAEQVAGVLANIAQTMPPLRGIIHAAGLLDDGVLLHQDWTRFSKVMAPKVDGTWHLHTLTQHQPLDFFVLFSSLASLLGSPGQGNHAAANAFMDALAHYRRAQGLPALSINWGAWSGAGAAVKHNVFERITLQGVGAIAPEQGLQLLGQLLNQAPAQVGVTPINWPVFRQQFAGGNLPHFFSEITMPEKSHEAALKSLTPQVPDFLAQLAEAPANKRQSLLLAYVQEQARKVLSLDSVHMVGERVPLNEMGLDSLMAVELRNLLGAGLKLKRALPATLVFDYPTVEAITGYLVREMALLEPTVQTGQVEIPEVPETDGQGLLDVLAAVEDLSDDEVDRLFAQKMGQMENWDQDHE